MKIALVVIVALCAAVCESIPNPRCKCWKYSPVNENNISAVTILPPKPYCNRRQVIVTLKNKKVVCSEPDGEQFKVVIAWIREQKSKNKSQKPIAPKASASIKTLLTRPTVNSTTSKQN